MQSYVISNKKAHDVKMDAPNTKYPEELHIEEIKV